MFFIDRIRNIIKYKNHSIVPSEIEAILLSHPGVEQAAVVPIRHECDGEWPLAFVKILRGKKVSRPIEIMTLKMEEQVAQSF